MPDALPDHERIRSARVVEVGYIAHPRSHQPQCLFPVKICRNLTNGSVTSLSCLDQLVAKNSASPRICQEPQILIRPGFRLDY
jgi:hypothetical protein